MAKFLAVLVLCVSGCSIWGDLENKHPYADECPQECVSADGWCACSDADAGREDMGREPEPDMSEPIPDPDPQPWCEEFVDVPPNDCPEECFDVCRPDNNLPINNPTNNEPRDFDLSRVVVVLRYDFECPADGRVYPQSLTAVSNSGSEMILGFEALGEGTELSDAFYFGGGGECGTSIMCQSFLASRFEQTDPTQIQDGFSLILEDETEACSGDPNGGLSVVLCELGSNYETCEGYVLSTPDQTRGGEFQVEYQELVAIFGGG